MIKLGVNTVLYKKYTLEEAAAELSKIGYDGMEVSAIEGMCEHLDLKNYKNQKNQINEISEKYNLALLSTEVASTDPERVRLAFEACSYIGIPIVNIGPGGKMDDEDSFAASLENISNLAKMADEYKINLCMKAHVGCAVYNTPTTIRAIEKIKNEFFGIDMDPSHIYRANEEPENALDAVAKAMKHVHIRDCEGRGPSPGDPLKQICGSGDINLYDYFKVLVNTGYNGPVCLEVIGRELELSEANIVAGTSYGYMNAILKNLKAR